MFCQHSKRCTGRQQCNQSKGHSGFSFPEALDNSRAITGRDFCGNFCPLYKSHQIVQCLWFRWFCECVSLHCAFQWRQNNTIYVKWAHESLCIVQRPGADYNFLLWQMGWSSPQYVVALQCYCLRRCYSARYVPFSSRGDWTWTQVSMFLLILSTYMALYQIARRIFAAHFS